MNKEEFKAKSSQMIDEFSAKMDALKAKKASVGEDVRSKYEKNIKELELKRAQVEERYAELKNASEEQWKETKNAFSSAAGSFRDGASKISALFS